MCVCVCVKMIGMNKACVQFAVAFFHKRFMNDKNSFFCRLNEA